MGIARGAYRLLLDEKKKGVLKGESVLQLGRQRIYFGYDTLHKYARIHGVKVDAQTDLCKGHLDDRTFFRALGFKNVLSLDYSDYEGADIVWDLNQPIPEKYWNKFDLIYDGGTGEHVFHFPQFLQNIHLMLKEGGVIIHDSPSNNHVDHGFYMYSPQLHSEYYDANGYQILTSHMIEYHPNHRRKWKIYTYKPGILDKLSYGNFGKRMLLIHLVAQKRAHSTAGATPQQGSYVKAWSAKNTSPTRRKKKIRLPLPFFMRIFLEKRKLKRIAQY